MKKFIIALRAPFLLGSIIPVFLSGVWSYKEDLFYLKPFLITLLGVAFLHLGANLINDYFDSKGSDPINLKVTPFSGGSRVIQEMGVGRNVVLFMSLSCFIAALLGGIWLMLHGRPLAILFGLIGLFLGWAYSSPPMSLMTKGLGEPVIFLAFGPLLTLSAYYAITGRLSDISFLLGISQGFFITNVIWINQFPDVDADRGANKENLVVKMGPSLARFVYGIWLFCGLFFPFVLVGTGEVSQLVLISFMAAPLGLRAFWILLRHYESHERLVPAQALTIKFLGAHGLLMGLGIVMSKFF